MDPTPPTPPPLTWISAPQLIHVGYRIHCSCVTVERGTVFSHFSIKLVYHKWLIAQLVECSLSVMKDPGSNFHANICSFRYWSVILLMVKLMSINGWSIYTHWWLMLEPIGQMTKTLNRIMYEERDHLEIVCNIYCIFNPTCMYCLVNKGQTSVKSNNV
jgi:hypothetical protein